MTVEKSNSPLSIVGVVLGLIGTGAGIWSQIDTRLQERQIEDLQIQVSQKAEARSERGAERDYLLKVTERVIEAMDSKSVREQDVARMLINTLTDSDIKRQLQLALQAAAVPEVKERLQKTIKDETKFAVDDAAPTPASTAGKVAVDIFWCEGPNATVHRVHAEQLRSSAEAAGRFGRVRVRPLPESVNQRPGYGIFSNIIRYEQDESSLATSLQKLMPSLGSQRINYNTVNYISAFFCSATK